MDKQKLAAMAVTICMGIFVVSSVRGDNEKQSDISNSIENIQSSIDAEESIKKELDAELEKLEEYKDDLLKYMEELNKTYDLVQQEIISLDSQISEKNKQIEEINTALDNAGDELDEQYEAMKARIQYMYEAGELDYVSVFLTSGDISDALNQVEYISQIVEYDRKMLDRYKESLAVISVMKENLEAEQAELKKLKETQQLKADELVALMDEASKNIKDKSDQISEAESAALKKEQEIAEMYDYLQYLEEVESSIIAESIRESISESIRLSEEASRQEASGGEQGSTEETTTKTVNDYEVQEGDLEKLAALIYCEAGGEPYEGKLAVGSVVMNRISNRLFPNTLDGVLTQPYQFSPVSVSGRYYIVLANKSYNSSSVKAAEEILSGVRTGNWHFFRTVALAISTGKIEANPHGVIIGNHFFY